MLPKVSFLLPVFNEETHLAAALASIFDQDYPTDRIEVVVAEGNSNDGTQQIIAEFQQRRP